MKQEYKEAFSEVNEIIKLMPDELVNKIPNEFRRMIEEESAKEYTPNIQEPLEQQALKDETIIVLGLIYRDFLCSPDEKIRLQEKDARELQKIQELQEAIEEEMRIKFNPDIVFKRENQSVIEEIQPNEENTSMIVMQEDNWYKKIYNIIKSVFKRRH